MEVNPEIAGRDGVEVAAETPVVNVEAPVVEGHVNSLNDASHSVLSGFKQVTLSEEDIGDFLMLDEAHKEGSPFTSNEKFNAYRSLLVRESASVLKILDSNGKISTVFADRASFDNFCSENECDGRVDGRYLFLRSLGIDDSKIGYGKLELIFSDSPIVHRPLN